MSDSTFFPRLLIGLYASGLVMLGVHEIHERHGKRSASTSSKENLVKDLVGASNIERGRFEVQKPPNDNLISGTQNQIGELIDSVAKHIDQEFFEKGSSGDQKNTN